MPPPPVPPPLETPPPLVSIPMDEPLAPAPLPGAPPQRAPAGAAPGESSQAGRFRWGLGLAGGTFFPIGSSVPQSGVHFGFEARFGYQASSSFAVYLNLALAGGFSASFSDTLVGASLIGYGAAGLLGELTVADRFFLALGPVLGGGGWLGASGQGSLSGAAAGAYVIAGGTLPGVDLKVGFGFGDPDASGRRNQFTLGLDLLTLFAPGARFGTGDVQLDPSNPSASPSNGRETTAVSVVMVPLLVLGFDAR